MRVFFIYLALCVILISYMGYATYKLIRSEIFSLLNISLTHFVYE